MEKISHTDPIVRIDDPFAKKDSIVFWMSNDLFETQTIDPFLLIESIVPNKTLPIDPYWFGAYKPETPQTINPFINYTII
jgi:hypothetical protein